MPKRTSHLHELFRKLCMNLCLLPSCGTSRGPNGTYSEKLLQINSFLLGLFFGWILPLWIQILKNTTKSTQTLPNKIHPNPRFSKPVSAALRDGLSPEGPKTDKIQDFPSGWKFSSDHSQIDNLKRDWNFQARLKIRPRVVGNYPGEGVNIQARLNISREIETFKPGLNISSAWIEHFTRSIGIDLSILKIL